MQLDSFDSDEFLSEYWQKKPLLIRNPWTDWSNPLEPDLLAGLACEEDVESRLVVRSSDKLTVENGPLAPDRFDSLGASNWTLLVQAVDHHDPAVAALIEPFRFIPDWRIDDVMVSYAADGGGVGAHFDNYDVFLVQGLGRRRWRVGQMCDASSPLMPHDDLRLLAEFEPAADYILEPGDMLYIPPGIAHEGTAVGDDCMTYSIGFRAPVESELMADYLDDLLETRLVGERFSDPDLPVQDNPGEISQLALERLHNLVTDRINDRTGFASWFGRFTSTPKYGAPEASYDGELLLSAADQGAPIIRALGSRFAFVRNRYDEAGLTMFADGRSYYCTRGAAPFAEYLCAQGQGAIDVSRAQEETSRALLTSLLEHGSLVIEDEDG